MKLITKIGAVLSTLAMVFGLGAVTAAADVDPLYVYYELEPGTSVELVKTVTTPTLAQKADVVIAMDLTGSMGGELTNLKSEVTNIINALALESTDLNIGIVSFMDYPYFYNYGGYAQTYGEVGSLYHADDVPFRVDYAVGSDFSTAAAAVNAMVLGYGWDAPESYARVMWEAGQPDSGIGFREGAQKIVVMFGDAMPHDLGPGNPFGNTGIDPGRDALAGTADDIDVEDDAITAMLAAGVTLIYLDSAGSTSWYGDTYYPGPNLDYWDNLATQTGGSAVGINSNGTIPGGISLTDLILGQIEEITPDVWWEVTSDSGLNVTLDPSVYYDVAGGSSLEFTETISLDEGDFGGVTLSATVTFYSGIYESGAGAVIGTQTIEILTPVNNEAPDVSEVVASIDCIWPPNHKLVDINILGVTDPDGDEVTITITSITSDEPTASYKGSGGPTHVPDAYGVGTDTASVRAERSGKGDGRVYVISFAADDGNGGVSEGSVSVSVPHDKSGKTCLAVDSGQNYDATMTN